jgi:hypothetical protein
VTTREAVTVTVPGAGLATLVSAGGAGEALALCAHTGRAMPDMLRPHGRTLFHFYILSPCLLFGSALTGRRLRANLAPSWLRGCA